MLNESLKQQFCPILAEIKLTVKKHSILLVKLINNPQLELGSNCLHSIVYSSLIYMVDIWVNVIYQISQTFQIFFWKHPQKTKASSSTFAYTAYKPEFVLCENQIIDSHPSDHCFHFILPSSSLLISFLDFILSSIYFCF